MTEISTPDTTRPRTTSSVVRGLVRLGNTQQLLETAAHRIHRAMAVGPRESLEALGKAAALIQTERELLTKAVQNAVRPEESR